VGYWRLGEFGARAADLAGKTPGAFEPGVVFALPGPLVKQFDGQAAVNRAAHFAGGRMTAKLPELGERYSVELWLWNGFPADARDWAGTPFALAAGDTVGDHLALGGKRGKPNVLAAFASGKDAGPTSGKTAVPPRVWTHVCFVRDGEMVRVYLSGKEEVAAKMPRAVKPDTLVVGGRPDRSFGFEGRVAEVAVYDRVLTAEEVAARVKAAGK
jgi:hypothetical protein